MYGMKLSVKVDQHKLKLIKSTFVLILLQSNRPSRDGYLSSQFSPLWFIDK